VLPKSVVAQLGLRPGGEVQVRHPDRATAVLPYVEQVQVELRGRRGTFRAIVEPNGDTARIGTLVLEDLDLVVSDAGRSVQPRHEECILAEVV